MAQESLSHIQSEGSYSLQPSSKGLSCCSYKSAIMMMATSLSMETLDQSSSLNS